ncbi:hypothetical protein PRABACTJOHN_00317 [Parabacteroides johnsonii DSM 18315]|uniref:Uncharacterized protein n=1 Tax=Parabacteroides johnsonii DSM 18315 TaxID=537006 RepID=B7B5M2_9BACT|nr:hypothetical protein PRABACTJOHN_00317 [Parabacteroides johnsonii DSM 18315]
MGVKFHIVFNCHIFIRFSITSFTSLCNFFQIGKFYLLFELDIYL